MDHQNRQKEMFGGRLKNLKFYTGLLMFGWLYTNLHQPMFTSTIQQLCNDIHKVMFELSNYDLMVLVTQQLA